MSQLSGILLLSLSPAFAQSSGEELWVLTESEQILTLDARTLLAALGSPLPLPDSPLSPPELDEEPSLGVERIDAYASTPTADRLRPANGNTSGPRWHWRFRLMRHT